MRGVRACLAVFPVAVSASDPRSFDDHLSFLQLAGEELMASYEADVPKYTRKENWHFCNSEYSSNLGGMGPDIGAPHEIRYKRVLTLPGGQEMDIVVVNTTEYTPKNIEKNGGACFGRINVRAPGTLGLQFKMVATGTYDFVGDYVHDFTILDLDNSKRGMTEEVITSGYIGTPLSPFVKPKPNGEAHVTFNGLDSSTATKDPKSPWNLTKPQLNASVGFKFSGASSWEVTFVTSYPPGSENYKKGGRNFLFTGATNLQYPEKPEKRGRKMPNLCDPPETLDKETGVCVIYRDPHIDGFDNPRNGPFLTRIFSLDMPKHSSFLQTEDSKSWSRDDPSSIDVNEYERGDFWLVKSAQLSIQGRYDASEEFPGGRSGLAALAVGGPMLHGGIVRLEPKRGAIDFFGKTIDDFGEHTYETSTGCIKIKTSYNLTDEDGEEANAAELTMSSGVLVNVRRYNTHLDVKINVPRQLGKVDGQCGNWNGDTTDDSLDAIAERMGSTKVLESELLFAKSFK